MALEQKEKEKEKERERNRNRMREEAHLKKSNLAAPPRENFRPQATLKGAENVLKL